MTSTKSMRLRYSFILLTALLVATLTAAAQKTRSLCPEIRSVRLLVDGETGRFPVITLGGGEVMEVSFDNLSHEYERFEYRLVHCDRDWQPSEGIMMSDAVDYTQESIPIEDYEYSRNTTQLYTHYQFEVPSEDVRPRISGNYRIEISRDGDYDDGLVAEACFMITEQRANVRMSLTDNTEIDWKQAHQQVQMTVDYGGLNPLPLNPREELSVMVLQNQRWDNIHRYVAPEYQMGTQFRWEHSRALIFDGGNEYRRFENTTTHHAAMGMESLRWHDPYYHARLRLAEVRRNYLYEQDRNGICVIRSTETPYSDTEADYMLIHFELQMEEPLPEGQHLYIQGQWTDDHLTEENEMHYDPERGLYECVMLLKQGYYNYLILQTTSPEKAGSTMPVEGNYYQTENEYDALVYYRNPFDRYDRLIGHNRYHGNH